MLIKKIFPALILVLCLTLTSCKSISDASVKRAVYDRYKNAKGFSATVTLSSGDNEIMSSYVTLDGEDYSFKIITPDVLKDIAFTKSGESNFVTYKDLKVETKNTPSGIKPLVMLTPLLKLDPDGVKSSKVDVSDNRYKLTYTDDVKSVTMDLNKENLNILGAVVTVDGVTYTVKFEDFKILE